MRHMGGGGIKSLAHKIAAHGRNGDTMLVHMQPREVALMQQLGQSTGDPLTQNPSTGLPEAFSFGKLLAGIGAIVAAPFTGGLSLAPGISLLGSSFDGGGGSTDAAAQTAALRQKQLQDFVKIPIVNTIQSPAPNPQTGLPGVTPEPIYSHQDISGYLTPGHAQGGPIESDGDGKVVVDAMAAFHGRHPRPTQAMEAFRRTFGDGELQHFLVQMQGGQARPGGVLSGPGAGMDDSIPATVDGVKPVMLSSGEYIIPADVVAHLGDGSTEAGARRLDGMRDEIRKVKTGRLEQPGKINPGKVLPHG